MLRSLAWVSVLSMIALATGCVDSRPSEGRCTGTLAGAPVDLAMDGAESEYHRDDDILLDDDGPFAMSYGGSAVVFSGELDDMPTSRDVGVHRSDSELFHGVAATVDGNTAYVPESTLTIDDVRLDRMVGSLDARFEDGSQLHCTYDLRRAFELDTDD